MKRFCIFSITVLGLAGAVGLGQARAGVFTVDNRTNRSYYAAFISFTSAKGVYPAEARISGWVHVPAKTEKHFREGDGQYLWVHIPGVTPNNAVASRNFPVHPTKRFAAECKTWTNWLLKPPISLRYSGDVNHNYARVSNKQDCERYGWTVRQFYRLPSQHRLVINP